MATVRDLLIAAIRDDPAPPDLPTMSWNQVPVRSREHGLTMRMNSLLTRTLTSAPAAVREEMRLESWHGIAGQLQMHADLRRMADALNAAEVTWVVVKGPVLSEHWYGLPAQRDYVDLDIVVDPSQFGRALDLLEAGGAALLDTNFSLALEQRRAELSLTLPGGSALDLHWHVLNSAHLRTEFSVDIHALMERRRPVEIGALTVPTLDPADSLMHICLHTVLSGGRKLCWYRDIYEVVASGTMPWDDLIDRTRAAGCGLLVAIALTRAARLTEAPVPHHVIAALRMEGRAWTTAIAAMDVLRPLGGPTDTWLSGALVVEASRHDSSRSARALARSVRHDLWGPLRNDPHHPWRGGRRRAGRMPTNPLSAPSSRQDRSRYLDYVAAQATLST